MAVDRFSAEDHDEPSVRVDGARGVVVGDHNSQTNVFLHAGPLVHSAYLEQVRRIAPTVLDDRERELAELVDFCLSEDGERYLWWRAPAWAGKSALMSWFVLHPPSGTQVISFFITAGLPGQDERRAFVDNVSEQLAAIVGHVGAPPYLTDATRDAHLLAMLAEAAKVCRERGQRLILVVDGLDEDRGVRPGPDMHSIAALLPAHPPMGMKIVVTGRPTPPIPFDVADAHPLRQLEIVRSLAASPHATVSRVDAEREMKRLSYGSPLEQDLLGLLTASGGGLSGRDLTELTDHEPQQVEDVLNAVAGRTFSRRPARWQPKTTPEVYALGHLELQAIAQRLIGVTRLAGFRQRIHAWAEQYRQQGWPPETPEYLLAGYFRVLQDSDDLPRMIAYARDARRHDRLLHHTGGDGIALEEIAAAQDAILEQPEPDLAAMCDLAVHRDGLVQRNDEIPIQLPAVWAKLGRVERAEALAQSINDDGGKRAAALALLARALGKTGDLSRAQALAQALPEHVYIGSNLQADTLRLLTESAAAAGDYRRADALADSIRDPYRQARARGEIALAVGRAGDLGEAEARACLVAEPYWRAQVLGVLAGRAAMTGQDEVAARLTAQADDQAAAIIDQGQRARAVGYLARLAAENGDQNRTPVLVAAADRLLQTVTDPQQRAEIATTFASFAAVTGDSRVVGLIEQAEVAARAIPRSYDQDKALAELATVIVQVGDYERAETLARSITDDYRQARALADVAAHLVKAGDHEPAQALADSLAESQWQATVITALAKEFATLGERNRAEALAQSVGDLRQRARALAEIADVLADTPDRHYAEMLAAQAETVARSIIEPAQRGKDLIEMASALALVGQKNRAMELVAQAGAVAVDATSSLGQKEVYTKLVSVGLAVEDYDFAEFAARSVRDPRQRVALLIQVISALIEIGRRDQAVATAAHAEADARLISNSIQQRVAVTELASLLTDLGECDRAAALARCLDAPHQGQVLTRLAQTAAAAGHYDHALVYASYLDEQNRSTALGHIARAAAAVGDYERAEVVVAQIQSNYDRSRVLTDLASVMAAAGEFDRAEVSARSIPNERERVQAMIALAQMADQTRARRLVAWALRNGTWSEPLTALARIQPDAVLGAADRLIQSPSRSAANDVLESARLVGSGVVEPKRIIGGDAGD